VIKNTLIDYIKNLIDYFVLESFLDVGKNTLINWNDKIIHYFFETIDYIDYLVDYRRL